MASPGNLCACSYAHSSLSCPYHSHHSPATASVPSSPSSLVSPRTPFGFSGREKAREVGEATFTRSNSFHSGSSFNYKGRRWSTDAASRPASLTPSPSASTPSLHSEFHGERLVFANEALTPGRRGRSFSRSVSTSASGGRFGEFEAIWEAESRDGDWDDGDSPTFARGVTATLGRRSSGNNGSSGSVAAESSSGFPSRSDSRVLGLEKTAETAEMTAAGAELAEAMAESGTMGPAALLMDRFDCDGGGGGGTGAVSARQRFPDFAEEGLPRGAPSTSVLTNGSHANLLTGSLSGLPTPSALPTFSVFPRHSDSAVHLRKPPEISEHLPSSARATSARAQPEMFRGKGSARGLLNPGAVTLPLFHVREGFCASFSAPGGGFGAPASSARLRRRVTAPAFAPFLKAASAPPAAPSAPSAAEPASIATGSAPPTGSSVQAAPLSSTVAFKQSILSAIGAKPAAVNPIPATAKPPSRRLPTYSRSASRTRSASSAPSAPPAHLRSPDLVAPQSLPARPTSPTPTLPPSPARQAPHFAPLPERKAPPALSPALPQELQPAGRSAGRPRRLPAVHALADGALALLVPLAGSGPQVLQMLGGPAEWVRRFVVSMGLAVALYSVSVIAAVTAAFYWAWWPIWRAVAKNLAMRVRYRHAGECNGLWKARLLDLQVVRVGRQTRWRVLIGDHSRTTLEVSCVFAVAYTWEKYVDPPRFQDQLLSSHRVLSLRTAPVLVFALSPLFLYLRYFYISAISISPIFLYLRYFYPSIPVPLSPSPNFSLPFPPILAMQMEVVPPHKSVRLSRGDPVELLVLSDCPSLSRFRAAREIFFPQRSLWLVGDKQACVERSVFEEMRRKVALRAAVEDGEDSEGEDWDGLYSLLTDENEQLLQNYSYNEASSMQAEMEGGGGKGVGGSLGGGLPGVGGFDGVAGGMSGGGATLGGITSFPEDLGVKEEQELMAHQGLLDYSAMEGAGSGGGFRDPALVSSFGGGGSVGAVADGLAASSSCLMDGGGSGPLSVLLSDSQDSELLERLREV
ncbi:unnamed protein product [Closterium sp. NIES-53]